MPRYPGPGEVLAGRAELVAKVLAAARVEPPETSRLGDGFHVPTRLTQTHRSGGRDGIRRSQKRTAVPKPRLAAESASHCGRALGEPRIACGATPATPSGTTHDLRPTRWRKYADAARRPGITQASARRYGTRSHPPSDCSGRNDAQAGDTAPGFGSQPSAFRRLVLPRIQGVASSTLARATGLSPGYRALIRDGKRIPHPRHWSAFQLVGLQAQDSKPIAQSVD